MTKVEITQAGPESAGATVSTLRNVLNGSQVILRQCVKRSPTSSLSGVLSPSTCVAALPGDLQSLTAFPSPALRGLEPQSSPSIGRAHEWAQTPAS